MLFVATRMQVLIAVSLSYHSLVRGYVELKQGLLLFIVSVNPIYPLLDEKLI